MTTVAFIPFTDAAIGACGVIVGVLITSVANLIQNHFIRRSEDRRIIAELVGKLALEQWKADCEATKRAADYKRNAVLSGGMLTKDPFHTVHAPTVAEVTKRIAREVEAIYYKPSWFSCLCPWKKK